MSQKWIYKVLFLSFVFEVSYGFAAEKLESFFTEALRSGTCANVPKKKEIVLYSGYDQQDSKRSEVLFLDAQALTLSLKQIVVRKDTHSYDYERKFLFQGKGKVFIPKDLKSESIDLVFADDVGVSLLKVQNLLEKSPLTQVESVIGTQCGLKLLNGFIYHTLQSERPTSKRFISKTQLKSFSHAMLREAECKELLQGQEVIIPFKNEFNTFAYVISYSSLLDELRLKGGTFDSQSASINRTGWRFSINFDQFSVLEYKNPVFGFTTEDEFLCLSDDGFECLESLTKAKSRLNYDISHSQIKSEALGCISHFLDGFLHLLAGEPEIPLMVGTRTAEILGGLITK